MRKRGYSSLTLLPWGREASTLTVTASCPYRARGRTDRPDPVGSARIRPDPRGSAFFASGLAEWAAKPSPQN